MKAELDTGFMSAIATQMMAGSGEWVAAGCRRLRVGRIGAQGLRSVKFDMNGAEYLAIEQNPQKPSRWGRLAREGRQVVQFKDVAANRFVGVAVDGEVTVYGGGRQR